MADFSFFDIDCHFLFCPSIWFLDGFLIGFCEMLLFWNNVLVVAQVPQLYRSIGMPSVLQVW